MIINELVERGNKKPFITNYPQSTNTINKHKDTINYSIFQMIIVKVIHNLSTFCNWLIINKLHIKGFYIHNSLIINKESFKLIPLLFGSLV